jgi:hypothetical protein
MNEIVFVRRSAEEHAAILDAVRAAFPEVIDVHRWDQVKVVRADSNGQVTASVAGRPLDEVAAVFHMASPGHGKMQPSREEVYLQQERDQSFLAALGNCHHVKIVNRGAVLCWNRGLLEPPAQLRALAGLGWTTPSVTQSFDLEDDVVKKLREPEPPPDAQDLVVIGLRRHVRRFTEAPRHPGLEALIARTQAHLRERQLDVCTVPFAMIDGAPVAFGMFTGPSADVPRAALIPLLREATS